MYYIAMKSRDIRQNLATEQYLMNEKEFDAPLLLFYIEGPSIIVGRNQNTLEEVNQKYVREHNITVTRRLSGGGAVYHDLGNLCFSFVVDAKDEKFGNFKAFTQPIVDALHELGATSAEVSGRNDMLIDGKKFSGSAMYTKRGKTFSHGTLMLDVDLNVVTHALNVPEDKIKSKGIKSVRSRVTNLRPYLSPEYADITTEQFRDLLIQRLLGVDSLAAAKPHAYQLTPEDEKEITKIRKQYYDNWDWVYGHSPEFTVKKRQHFDMGTIDARFLIHDGKIANVVFYGDFFGAGDASELAEKLKGVVYDRQHVEQVLQQVDTQKYFNGIPETDLLNLLVE
ncbi:lipoate--protein ligase [Loigolactobacillus rennini]|uniref:lipoate--protein ligase n=1 Tax=Loigolactobacillus rennini DSM 20253 TaxID=1423796 RepID=A0A0R2D5L4_9LACO|nr:lipoate--protein ligase [Loigolactobacillus rennini]KRM99272.1 Lipoate-protein ligase A [Loigolactobacillus rennini DSM 20253]